MSNTTLRQNQKNQLNNTGINQQKLRAFADELAKDIHTQDDLADLSASLVKMTIEAALGGEMEHHLGYPKHGQNNNTIDINSNARNGYYPKIAKSNHGEIKLAIPRDRSGDFEPLIVEKGQTRLGAFDSQILSLYAKGMSTRDIVSTFKEMYDADISATLVSNVTQAVIAQATEWRNRPLDEVYPIVYLDGIVIKVRQDKQIIKKTMYIALGVNLEGKKECLGLWLSKNESSKFWLGVLNDIANRGVKDILIASVDGLTGFPEAINAVFPQADVQLCIVHMVRNSLKYVGYKDKKQVASSLKQIYQSISEDEALLALDEFEHRWGKTSACGNTALMASGKPVKPSTEAIRMSLTPRLAISLRTPSQNLEDSFLDSHRPKHSFLPSRLTPRAIYIVFLMICLSCLTLITMPSK